MPKGPSPYPVSVRGQIFPSVRACAEHFGLDPSTVYTALRRGREDYIGLGHHRTLTNAHRKKPLTIGNLHFTSRREAANALGYAHSQSLNWARKNHPERVLQRAMKLERELAKKKKEP